MSRPKLARYGITIGIVLDFIESLLAVAPLLQLPERQKDAMIPTMT